MATTDLEQAQAYFGELNSRFDCIRAIADDMTARALAHDQLGDHLVAAELADYAQQLLKAAR